MGIIENQVISSTTNWIDNEEYTYQALVKHEDSNIKVKNNVAIKTQFRKQIQNKWRTEAKKTIWNLLNLRSEKQSKLNNIQNGQL